MLKSDINYVKTGNMDLKIEKKLSEYKTHILDYATIKTVLANNNYENINGKIANLKKKNIITLIKKGLYIHNSQISKTFISKELLSNNLLENPSYISLDYALSYHGLIPEAVHEITALTTARTKIFATPIGVFSYRHIKKELFNIGLHIERKSDFNFLIAGAEKALCDKIYFTKDVVLTSKTAMLDFLEKDLRIDLEDLENLDLNIFMEYHRISRSKKIKLMADLIPNIRMK